MSLKLSIAALLLAASASPVAATHPEPDPDATAAPAASESALYCLHIEITGSRLEKTLCLTRQEWVEQEVDLDEEWAENGVRVIG